MGDLDVFYFIEKLRELLQDHTDLIFGIKYAVKNLLEDVDDIYRYIKLSAHTNRNSSIMQYLFKEFRTLVNSAEVTIDKFVIYAKLHKNKGVVRFFDFVHCRRVRDTVFRINSIRERLKKLVPRIKVNFQYEDLYQDPLSIKRKSSSVEVDQVVGFDKKVKEIINRLVKGSDSLEVIPIVGMAGLGKTTLAYQVYRHPEVACEFTTRIWLHVSESYSIRQLLLNIISVLTQNTKQFHDIQEDDLPYKVRELLGKVGKYLIILDDVWTTEVWECISSFFVNNNKGSRVLLTTRNSSVAKHCSSVLHYLEFLTTEESWILLEKKVFHNGKCPVSLEIPGRSIASKCKGLPLAISLIAGALIGEDKKATHWEKVNQTVGARLMNVNSRNFSELIQMSYDRLPKDVKACFLYFGAFPPGFDIPSWKLIRLWIAEGFVPNEGSLSLECKAEDNLNDLVDRNLVMVMTRTSDGRVKTCCVHDMLHEFCIQEAMKEGTPFQEIKLGVGQRELSTYRRLCIHSSVLDFLSTKSSCEHVRSFLSFGSKQIEMPSCDILTIPRGFLLLRVFEIESIKFSRFPREFFQLYHLRYLCFSSDTMKILPKPIGGLWNIQTLIINTQQSTLDIQADIWNMLLLRHLHTKASAKLPMPVYQKSSKATLVNQSLQTLSTISPESCTVVFERAPKLKKLGIRGKIAVLLEPNKYALFENIKKLEYLESLKLINDSTRIENQLRLPPAHIFPTKLRKLTLLGTLLEWNDMFVLGLLKHLEVLKLKENGFYGEHWKTELGGFCSLWVLWIECTNLAHWDALAANFPTLKHLVLISCNKLQEIPIGLADIPSFQEMKLQNSTRTAAISAQRIQAKKERTAKAGFKLSISHPDL